MNVLILDDDTARANSWRDRLGKLGVNSTVPTVDQVGDLIADLQSHRLKARDGEFCAFENLDSVDLLVVDYDLLGLRGHGWTTGAEVAYAARLLTRVGPVVVVNQFGTNGFDLTMRRGATSHADMDIGSDQISNHGLFRSCDFEGYRPWFWPNLINESSRLADFSEFVAQRLDASISAVLGFELEDPLSSRFLSREVCAPIALTSTTTFRDLAAGVRSGSLSGIIEKDQALSSSLPVAIVARVAASLLSRWIERFVVPNQDVIVDYPHAIASAPWLMQGEDSLTAWNDFGLRSQAPKAMDLTSCELEYPFLSSRTLYWRGGVDAVERPSGFAMSSVPDFVFCEDTSRFHPTEEAQEFSASLESYLNTRWVRLVDERVLYEPQAYLLG